jgi:hypothetical protein
MTTHTKYAIELEKESMSKRDWEKSLIKGGKFRYRKSLSNSRER